MMRLWYDVQTGGGEACCGGLWPVYGLCGGARSYAAGASRGACSPQQDEHVG